MTRIVINECYGGFGLSDAAFERYLDLKGITWYRSKEPEFGFYRYYSIPEEEWNKLYEQEKSKTVTPDTFKTTNKTYLSYYDIERDDPILVQVVEELGDLASGSYSKLKVVEIPDDVNWEIDEYDGLESIHEVHRTWS